MGTSPLVGRESEIAALCEFLARAEKGAGRAMILTGEAGIGKTRLVEEALAIAERSGFSVLRGSSSSESAEPFLALSRALGARILPEERHTGFSLALAIDGGGAIVAKALHADTAGLDAESLPGLITTIQTFARDSFGGEGSLGRMEYGGMAFAVEQAGKSALVVAAPGAWPAEMGEAARETARQISQLQDAPPEKIHSVLDALVAKRFRAKAALDGVRLDIERLRIADNILADLASASESKPVLLVLEDLHWADDSTFFVVSYLARNAAGKRLAMLGTIRPGDSPKSAEALALMRESGADELALAPLDAASAKAMMDSRYSPNRFPPELAGKLAADCRGNPFFLAEMLSQMESDGAIRRAGEAWTLSEGAILVPTTIGEMALRRLESLDPDAMAMAEYASCIGREFPLAAAMSLGSVASPSAALESLGAAGIVSLAGASGAFSHAIFQGAIYGNVSQRWKTSHHRAIGEHYEKAFAGREDEALYELARHFSLCGDRAKGYGYCVRAGEKAEASYAAEQAVWFYGKASSFAAPGSPEWMSATERLGDLQMFAGDFPAALESYAAVLGKSSESRAQAAMRGKRAEALEKLSRFEDGKAECALGITLLAGSEVPEAAKLAATMGKLQMRLNSYDEAIATLDRGLELAARLGERSEESRMHHILGSTHLYKSDYPAALEHLHKAIEIRRALGNLQDLSSSLNNTGNVHARKGENDLALGYYVQSVELDRKVGDKMGVGSSLSNLATIYLGQGKPDAAIPPLEESIDIAKRIGDMRGAAISLINLNMAHYQKNDYEKATALLAEARDICTKHGLKYESTFCHNNLSVLYLQAGRLSEARESAEKAIAASREIDTKDGEAIGFMNLGNALRESGDLDKSLEALERALAMMAEQSHNQLPDCQLELGALWARKGDSAKSREFVSLAIAGYESRGDNASVEKARKALGGLP